MNLAQSHTVLNRLHPIARQKFRDFFAGLLEEPHLSIVRPFEGTRSPEKQDEHLAAGNSKVGAWRSVHQYGCAVDWVPCPAGQWTWDWDRWDDLHRLAERFGLHAPIEWDKPHIVVVGWRTDLRAWLLTNSFT